MARIFLCHANEDKPEVEALYDRLRDLGFEPWMDKKDLIPGQRWQQEIPRAIKSSALVLICLSQNIGRPGFVQREFKLALDALQEMPEEMIHTIPVRLEPCDVPEPFITLHWCDLFEEDGFDRLAGAIRFGLEQRFGEGPEERILAPSSPSPVTDQDADVTSSPASPPVDHKKEEAPATTEVNTQLSEDTSASSSIVSPSRSEPTVSDQERQRDPQWRNAMIIATIIGATAVIIAVLILVVLKPELGTKPGPSVDKQPTKPTSPVGVHIDDQKSNSLKKTLESLGTIIRGIDPKGSITTCSNLTVNPDQMFVGSLDPNGVFDCVEIEGFSADFGDRIALKVIGAKNKHQIRFEIKGQGFYKFLKCKNLETGQEVVYKEFEARFITCPGLDIGDRDKVELQIYFKLT